MLNSQVSIDLPDYTGTIQLDDVCWVGERHGGNQVDL